MTLLAISLSSVGRGLLGILTILAIAAVFSSNRKQISWRLVIVGLGLQLGIALGVLHIEEVKMLFDWVGQRFVDLLNFTKAGTEFLFPGFLDQERYGFVFAFQVLPTIIFFAALTSVLFYLGIIQKFVYALAWLMSKTLGISGPESMSVAGNIFLGQTESPLMIKAYLDRMTRSEMLLVMSGGMATLAGGVLAAYINFLGGGDPVQSQLFAKHLLAASVMAAPGAIVVSKILIPETETVDGKLAVGSDRFGSNLLDALSNGTREGVKLAVNIAGMLLVFIAFLAMLNAIFGAFGSWFGLNEWVQEVSGGTYKELNLQFALGYLFAPLMWLIGVNSQDITLVGRLLGEKLIMTEFIGYVSLAELKEAGAFASQKSIIMGTYLLCGFANFASIGIQIGGIGALAPSRRGLLSELGLRALLAGTLASLLSAAMVGMLQ